MNVSETDKKYLKILWYNYLKQKSQTGVTIVENHDFFYEDTGTLIINYFISSRAIPKLAYARILTISRILEKKNHANPFTELGGVGFETCMVNVENLEGFGLKWVPPL